MNTSITVSDLYQRQITLIGNEAFEKIRNSRILVVGVGGLGCPALQYLASAGVGEIGLLDFDSIAVSNLQRQILFEIQDVGEKKASVAKAKLERLAPFSRFQVYLDHLNESNAEEIFTNYDLVLDCTDNFLTKFLIHDTCLKMKKTLIQASVYQFEGQLQLFDFAQTQGPCLRCLWPEEPIDGCTGTCAEVGVMGPLLGVMGSLQANEALKLIIGEEHLLNGQTMFVDLVTNAIDIRRFKQVHDCLCCVKNEFIKRGVLQIDLPHELSEYTLLDVRSKEESANCFFINRLEAKQGILNIPLEEIANFSPQTLSKYLVICSKGIRSLKACQILKTHGAEAYSLIGGVESLD